MPKIEGPKIQAGFDIKINVFSYLKIILYGCFRKPVQIVLEVFCALNNRLVLRVVFKGEKYYYSCMKMAEKSAKIVE